MLQDASAEQPHACAKDGGLDVVRRPQGNCNHLLYSTLDTRESAADKTNRWGAATPLRVPNTQKTRSRSSSRYRPRKKKNKNKKQIKSETLAQKQVRTSEEARRLRDKSAARDNSCNHNLRE